MNNLICIYIVLKTVILSHWFVYQPCQGFVVNNPLAHTMAPSRVRSHGLTHTVPLQVAPSAEEVASIFTVTTMSMADGDSWETVIKKILEGDMASLASIAAIVSFVLLVVQPYIKTDIADLKNNLKDDIKMLHMAIIQLGSKMEKDLNATKSELKDLGFKMEKDLNATKSELKAEITELRADIKGIKSDVNGVKSDVNGVKAEMKNLGAIVKGRLDNQDGKIKNWLDAQKVELDKLKLQQEEQGQE